MTRKAACILPSLGLPIGFAYFWSRNVTYFTGTAVLVSALALFIVCVLLYCLNYFVLARLVRRFLPQRWGKIVFALLIGAQFAFCAFGLVDYHLPYQRRLWGTLTFVLTTVVLLYGKERILAVFSGVLLLMSAGLYVFNFANYSYQQHQMLKETGFDAGHVVFRRKPNIYFFWLESYQDFDLLEKIYGVDCSGLEKFLLENGFVIQENTYSSAGYTIEALVQFFTGREITKNPVALADALWEIRRIIGGNGNNTFYRVLKENGYTTCFITEIQHYLFSEKGGYLDEVALGDRKLRDFTPLLTFMHRDTLRFFSYDPQRLDFTMYALNGTVGKISYMIRKALQKIRNTQPYLLMFRGGAAHTPVDYDWPQRDAWIASQYYQNLVKESNQEIEEIVGDILKEDPDSIIILLGDHGPLTYRNFPINTNGIFKQTATTPRAIFDDSARVLFAWRLPGGNSSDLTCGKYVNNLNLMWHLFSWLADDQSLLEKRAVSVTRLGMYTMIEGKEPVLEK